MVLPIRRILSSSWRHHHRYHYSPHTVLLHSSIPDRRASIIILSRKRRSISTPVVRCCVNGNIKEDNGSLFSIIVDGSAAASQPSQPLVSATSSLSSFSVVCGSDIIADAPPSSNYRTTTTWAAGAMATSASLISLYGIHHYNLDSRCSSRSSKSWKSVGGVSANRGFHSSVTCCCESNNSNKLTNNSNSDDDGTKSDSFFDMAQQYWSSGSSSQNSVNSKVDVNSNQVGRSRSKKKASSSNNTDSMQPDELLEAMGILGGSNAHRHAHGNVNKDDICERRGENIAKEENNERNNNNNNNNNNNSRMAIVLLPWSRTYAAIIFSI